MNVRSSAAPWVYVIEIAVGASGTASHAVRQALRTTDQHLNDQLTAKPRNQANAGSSNSRYGQMRGVY
jgi:hypothetical protein